MKVYIRNKFFTLGGSSVVKDEGGNSIFKVKGNIFTFTRKKRLYDMQGNLLYKIRNRFLNFFIHKAYIYDANGTKIATVKDRWINLFKEYFVQNYKDEVRTDGKFFSLSCNIYKNGEVAGRIRRRINFVDSFELDVPDAEDVPFLIAFVIAIDNITDEIRNDNN